MRRRLFLALLVLSILVSACVSKPQEGLDTSVPEDGTGTEAADELPDIDEVTEDELTPEPDLDINDTIDFGSLL